MDIINEDEKNSIKTSIGKNGYTILKSSLQEYELNQIKKDLTVKPKVCQNYGADAATIEPIILYLENEDKIYVPRYYGVGKFNQPSRIKLQEPQPANLNFPLSLRKQQEGIVDCYFKNIDLSNDRGGGGVICAGCGVGKTVISLYVASKIKLKTIVIVHKEFLMNQWVERIEQFLPGAKIGRIQGEKIDIEDKDIVIGMLQSVSMHQYPAYVFKGFGLAIYDECHHLGARVFSKALRKTAFKYTLGLSATPSRKDGLTRVFLWYLGDIVYKQGKNTDSDVDVKVYYYHNDDPTYNKEVRNFKKQIMNPIIINNIAQCEKRNNFILSLLPKLLDEGRTILILTERISQVTYIHDIIEEQELTTIGKYIGRLKQEVLDESLKCRIIIGTYNMIEEGFDCKSLDTLIMATPKVDIEQSVGRILRKQKEERTIKPLVIDVYDQFANCVNKGKKRLTFYKKQKYNVTKFMIDDNQVPYLEIKMKDEQKGRKDKKSEMTFSF